MELSKQKSDLKEQEGTSCKITTSAPMGFSPPESLSPKTDDAGVDSPICRICYEGPGGGKLIAPCKCKGSLQYVHRHCFKKWLKIGKNVTACELCLFRFITFTRKKSFLDWCRVPENSEYIIHVVTSVINLIALIILTVIVAFGCQMIVNYCGSSHKDLWEKVCPYLHSALKCVLGVFTSKIIKYAVEVWWNFYRGRTVVVFLLVYDSYESDDNDEYDDSDDSDEE